MDNRAKTVEVKNKHYTPDYQKVYSDIIQIERKVIFSACIHHRQEVSRSKNVWEDINQSLVKSKIELLIPSNVFTSCFRNKNMEIRNRLKVDIARLL